MAVHLPLPTPLTYRVPEGWQVQVGTAVQVPLGPRRVSGTIIELMDESDVPRTLPIAQVLDEQPVVTAEQLRFLEWTASYYLSSLGEVLSTALPTPYRAHTRRTYQPTQAGIASLAREELSEDGATQVLREIVAHPGRTRTGLARVLHAELEPKAVGNALTRLKRRELIEIVQVEARRPGSLVHTVRLLGSADSITPNMGARMRGVLAHLVDSGGAADLAELVRREGSGARDAVRRLEARGLVARETREDRAASAVGELLDDRPAPPANPHQLAALQALATSEPRTWLLHGVTGSGKTEVYLQAASRVLQQGRQVLVLVPEIALTPQLTGRFRGRFGDRVAVLHSGLTPSDRLREWRRIRAGEAQVAVGARSALFAPFRELGLVVVDEEHDDSYKQDDGVRYHARDLAVLRGRQTGCPVVLGSATPSLESWHNAREGRYGLLSLPERATPRPVPEIEVLDMRGRPPDEVFSPTLEAALDQTLSEGGKAIVLYNRRGFAPVVECPGCGAHFECPSCGVNLVLHQRSGRLTCHYCGYHHPYEPDCAACGESLTLVGHGTERVEARLAERYPDVGIARMDADTTGARGSHHRILERFRSGDARLLVGTQAVAKGHDFPDVYLSAVVGVDHVLMLPDFRSAERTYALVTQLAGRAGRGDRAGRVLVQTRHPDHFVFRNLGESGDPTAFYEEEARLRHLLAHPPYTRLVLLRLEGTDHGATQRAATALARSLRHLAAPHGRDIDVLGPVAAPLSRLVGRWRLQIVLRGRLLSSFRRFLAQAHPQLRTPSGVRLIVDVDPRNLL